ncbi:hypothetical protein [Microbulbifer epialgicus]|uniref:DUF2946 domain-containing protein n=1 Tax=Microbulbifer epialgicus TaxID=393907 RepID=A0ABV4P1E9_9GAMM
MFARVQPNQCGSVASMNVVRLSLLLIVLLVFQTAGAFYDSHEEVQDVTSHLSLHHVDQADHPGQLPSDNSVFDVVFQNPLSGDDSGQSAPLLDFCNHCCHCHGSTLTGLLGQSFQPILRGSITYREFGNGSVPSGYFSPLLRPPIAQA